jgi:ribonuclease HII
MPTLQPIIAGVDEAGRGCLAGPVVAGAVILPKRVPKKLLKDSKILSEKQREAAYEFIIKKCDFGVGMASAQEIDKLNIKRATELAMRRAVEKLKTKPDHLMIDGRDTFTFDIPSEDFVKGDARFAVISAAGIVAKVTRDRFMKEQAKIYQNYGLERHKGYGSALHIERIKQYGHCELHRTSFNPLRTWLTQPELLTIT